MGKRTIRGNLLRRFKGSVKENCEVCGRESEVFSSFLPLCLECIRGNPDKSLEIAGKVHAGGRKEVGLIPEVPQHPEGKKHTGTIMAQMCKCLIV